MATKNKYHKVEIDGNYLISSSMADIISSVESHIEDIDPLDDPVEVLFSTVEMTSEEILNLPDFDGF